MATPTWQRLTYALVCGALFGISAPADAQVVNVRRQAVPDYHTVERGDTLWDLSGRYFGDSFDWPRMWAYNPHITNPHWIYPGDVVYLRPREGDPKPSSGKAPRRVNRSPFDPDSMRLYMATGGFVLSDDDFDVVGRIVGSFKQARLLGELDRCYVGFGDEGYTAQERDELDDDDMIDFKPLKGEVRPGDIFAIIRVVGEITNDEGDPIGLKYWVLGSLRVTEVNKKYLEKAEILQSWFEIERGDLLVPYDRQLVSVMPQRSEVDQVARVAETLQPLNLLGEFNYLFVNKGKDQGVKVGNRFYIYKRGDGMRERELPEDEIPYERVGQVMVIDTRKNYSTAVVVDASREIEIGDRLERYKGF